MSLPSDEPNGAQKPEETKKVEETKKDNDKSDGSKDDSPKVNGDSKSKKDDSKDEKDDSKDTNGESKEKDDSKDKKDDKDDKKEKVPLGSLAERRDLYRTYDKNHNITWTDKIPSDFENAVENDDTLKYAVIVRNNKSDDSRKAMEIWQITIQSPWLKKALGKILEDYPGVNTNLSNLTFTTPFEPLVHRWDRFVEAKWDAKNDKMTKEHLQLLYDIMYPELKDVITAREDYLKNGVVSFNHIWTLFPPRSTLFGSRYGYPAAFTLKSTSWGKTQGINFFMLDVGYVDWDGRKFGYMTTYIRIISFEGLKPITELSCFPIQFHANPIQLKKELVERGRTFRSLAGYHYKYYKGQAITYKQGRPSLESVDGRIVIDAASYESFNPNQSMDLGSLEDDDDPYDSDDNELPCEETVKLLELDDDKLLVCSPIIRGYALRMRKWLEFYVGDVGDITFNTDAFDSLILRDYQKELILAFSQSQVKYKTQFDDVIAGKGKGIIMLLSGSPGIGKTLTAESVAEQMRVPLYVMSAGSLGSTAYDVEENLEQILQMVANWNAVLLLDECDVFLEDRATGDLERNAIVAIFLRTLEYYEGILFLTTNRVDNIDPAFHSRIHITMEYPSLDEDARRKVWAGFLDRRAAMAGSGKADKGSKASSSAPAANLGKAHSVTTEELDRLAGVDINGRQIKNVLKTAGLLALHRKEVLGFRHIRAILSVEGFKVRRQGMEYVTPWSMMAIPALAAGVGIMYWMRR